MAISYVGGVQGGRAGATSTTTQSLSGTLTGGSNSSPSTGDLVIVWCSAAGDGTGSPANQAVSGNNSGAYTAETFQSITTATYDSFSQFNYKIQGTVDTSLTIPSSGNARNAQRWVVHVFRGVDNTTPIDTASQAASGTATGRPNPAAITPATAGAWILGLYASAAATGTAYTAPTDFATDWLGGTTIDTADVMQGAGYYTGWTSGAYDPAAITSGGTTNAADSWTARTVALRPQAAVTHATTGALTGQGSTIAGSAAHIAKHATSGTLAGQSSTVVGSATRKRVMTTTGVLTGPGSVIAGSADRQDAPTFVTHAATGALTGAGSSITGSAARLRAMASTGALVGQGSVIVGSASNYTVHGSSGVLVGAGSTVVGSAARHRAMASTGALTGAGAALAGSAARSGAPAVHETTGALQGAGSVIDASATRTGAAVTHETSGALVGGGSALVGLALSGAVVVGRRQKRYGKAYLKRDNEILVFQSEDAKEDYLKTEEQAKQAINRAQRRKVIAAQPKPVKVDIEQVKEQAKQFEFENIQPLIVENNFQRIIEIHLAIQQMLEDEDEIELLLLA